MVVWLIWAVLMGQGPGPGSPPRGTSPPDTTFQTPVAMTLSGILQAHDTPNDAGKSITLTWKVPEDLPPIKVTEVYRSTSPEGPFELVTRILNGSTRYIDQVERDRTPYYYRLVFLTQDQRSYTTEVVGPVMASPQWFHTGRINILLGVILYVALLLWYIVRARRGEHLFLRKIPGLEAVDEAIGRATEMGRPILYVPGLSTIDDIATIASLNILSHVTKKAAEYETPIIVPNRNPVVYTVAREVIKEAYTTVGRPDLFNPDNVFYVTDSQFGYAAAVCGIMVREKPATNFLMGMFWAESLLLAETGAATGAIQISGTDAITQLPFFIVACDYTLIGEELYAASAYLSKEPLLMATLKGQDWMKFILGVLITVGSVLGLFGIRWVHLFLRGG